MQAHILLLERLSKSRDGLSMPSLHDENSRYLRYNSEEYDQVIWCTVPETDCQPTLLTVHQGIAGPTTKQS